jgi:hypothetical protein
LGEEEVNTTVAAGAESAVIRIHPADDVVIARRQLLSGTRIDSEGITVSGLIPPGHKVAVRTIRQGAAVRRYNQIIGTATQDIAPGQHVHTHNLVFSSFERAHDVGSTTSDRARRRPRSSTRRPRSWASCATTAASPRAITSACSPA